MRETSFIHQNKDKWREFESVLDGAYQDPEKLNDLFVQITDDLSYSRTFYPNRSVRVYLNSLAQRIFFTIYKRRRAPGMRIGHFWLEELPRLVYEARRDFLLSFLIFAVAFGTGVLSSAMDPEFAATILGEDYVSMTLKNIESGDPMAVYKQRGKLGMSVGITANNLFVAFLTFVMGIFFALGSIVIMIQNGVMVGAFQYFFIERGLFWESFLTIWIHGTLEISAIIIAGAAGITMGKGLVFPDTYTRIQSFQRAARRGIKIMLGIAPIIVLAGFFEGYLTRHTDTPDSIRALFILSCLLFVITYFIWYPLVKARRGFTGEVQDARIPSDEAQQVDFTRIQSSGEIFTAAFVLYKKHFGRIATMAALLALAFTGIVLALSEGQLASLFLFPSELFGSVRALKQFFNHVQLPWLPVLNMILFAILTGNLLYWVYQENQAQALPRLSFGQRVWRAGLPLSLPILLLTLKGWFLPYLLLAILPVSLIWAHTNIAERGTLLDSFGRSLALLQHNAGRIVTLMLDFTLIGVLFFLIGDTMLLWFYLDLVSWIIHTDAAAMQQISAILLTFITLFILYLTYSLAVIGFGLLYYTIREIHDATHLRQRIQHIGRTKRIKGLERES